MTSISKQNFFDTLSFTDIRLRECGKEQCTAVKNITSAKKEWHTIHYVIHGRGFFERNGTITELKKGDMFYIPPNTQGHYFADRVHPWIYSWIGFDGNVINKYLQLCSISDDNPTFEDSENLPLLEKFNALADRYTQKGILDLHCLALLIEIFAIMLDNRAPLKIEYSIKEAHVKHAIEYISYNYQFEITVQDIAHSLNLTPTYLANIFRETLNMSPKQYLKSVRMNTACKLLEDQSRLIKEVALLVGYKDQLHFSSEFKKYKKTSPLEYRKLLEKESIMKQTSTFGLFLLLFAFSSCTFSESNEKQLENGITENGNTPYTPTIGDRRNHETLDDLVMIYSDDTAKTVKVVPVENINKDFAFGVDISSVIEVENAGGVFYNDKGEEQDVFEILKDNGINYVRFRHWNNPKHPLFDTPFGGGNNDITTNLEIAKRAKRVGLKICLDFHYSDFWADPEVQVVPYEWATITQDSDLEDKVYEYTKEVLEIFEDEGVLPDSVQLGNEINNGLLGIRFSVLGEEGYKKVAGILQHAGKAVKDVSKNIKTIIHLAEGASFAKIDYFYGKMEEYKVPYDIIGLSYYSYWHGSIATLKDTLNKISQEYDKPVMIMEYSYGFTDKVHANASHIYHSSMETHGGYGTSFQGQSSYIRDVINAVNSIPNNMGLGAFYWEPAWLPVANAGWASEGARDHLENSGKHAANLDKVTWANQGLFSYTGKGTPSLKVFNAIKSNNEVLVNILNIDEELNYTINIAKQERLPDYTTAYTDLHSYMPFFVDWNTEDVNAITASGNYTVKGSIQTPDGQDIPVLGHVVAIENFVENNSFEVGGRITSDVTDFANVDNWIVSQDEIGNVKIQGKDPKTGFNNANIYSSKDFTFDLYQKIENLTDGPYRLSVWIRSESAKLPNMSLYASSSGVERSLDGLTPGSSWAIWVYHELDFDVVNNNVTIGIRGDGKAGAWAHIDDFVLVKRT